jgi:hypothetical protein
MLERVVHGLKFNSHRLASVTLSGRWDIESFWMRVITEGDAGLCPIRYFARSGVTG